MPTLYKIKKERCNREKGKRFEVEGKSLKEKNGSKAQESREKERRREVKNRKAEGK